MGGDCAARGSTAAVRRAPTMMVILLSSDAVAVLNLAREATALRP